MLDDVLVTRSGAIFTVCLNRPARLNALNGASRASLRAALEAAAADTAIRAVVLRGEGPGFCAGQDLADLPNDADLGALLTTEYVPLVRLIRTMPKPVVAAVHGVAAGAGASLALNCDLVVAAESARFVQAFIRIGLLPDAGASWLLPRLVGSARARAMAMLGTPISGAEAAAMGMIYRAVPEDRLAAEIDVLAETVAALPTQAMAAIKRTFDAAEVNGWEAQLEAESAVQSILGDTPDFAEGRLAFLEKRPPRFTGGAA